MSNFQPLEVVDRGSETQLQVVENLKKFTPQNKGSYPVIPKPLCVENLLRDAKIMLRCITSGERVEPNITAQSV